ncbi:MAG: DUF4838 domain-containing protein [Clostridia bacterium]|nr:DUF4838 domain-containing protein [Clostridia bacterium]
MLINGISAEKYTLLSANDNETIQTAKKELKNYFFAAAKAEIKEGKAGDEYKIMLGTGASNDDLSKIKYDDGFIIKTEGKNLIISGKTDEGTLFGVYHFIEHYLGVDWLTPEVETYSGTKEVKDLCIVYDFKFRMRVCHSYFAFREVYRARQRLNYTVGEINDKPAYGGLRGLNFAFSWGLFGHTFEVFIPYEEFYSTHPEWFSFFKGMEGVNHRYQICLTNPEVLKVVTDRAVGYLEKHPECKIISISQNDSYAGFVDNYCMCENCRKIFEADGNYSAVNIQFVNKVAKVIKEKFPDVLVHTFAYNYSRPAPNTVKPEKNIVVQYCVNLPLSSALTDKGEREERELSFLNKWMDISDKMFVWTYNCDFANYIAPIGNFRALYYNTIYYLRRNFIGIFQQERYAYYPCEFSELRTYLTAKMLQNPDMTHEEYRAYIKKFMLGVFGKGGEYIAEYIDLLDAKYAGVDTTGKLSDDERLKFFADKKFIDRGYELYRKAEELANEDEKYRLLRNRMQLDFCQSAYLYLYGDKKEYREFRKDFVAKLVKYGVRDYRENCPIPRLDRLDYSKSPFLMAQEDKIAFVGQEYAEYASGDVTDDKYGFAFKFAVKSENGGVKAEVAVMT